MSRKITIASAVAATALCAGGLGVLATPASAATSSTAAKAASCDKAAWASRVQGTPKSYAPGAPGGVYLWHDTHGFRLRVTHGTNHDQRVYSGEVSASAAMHIDPVKLEKGDYVRLSASHKTLVFSFANHGYIDGVNFHTNCANTVAVSHLHVGNSNLSASHVYLGADRTHPKSVPFTLHRQASKPSSTSSASKA